MQQGDCLNWDFVKWGERLAPDRYQDFVSVRSLRAAFRGRLVFADSSKLSTLLPDGPYRGAAGRLHVHFQVVSLARQMEPASARGSHYFISYQPALVYLQLGA